MGGWEMFLLRQIADSPAQCRSRQFLVRSARNSVESGERTARGTLQKVNAIRAEFRRVVRYLKDVHSKSYRKELVELLFEQPYVRAEMVAKHLDVDPRTARKYLEQLRDTGIVHRQQTGRERLYLNDNLLKILGQPAV